MSHWLMLTAKGQHPDPNRLPGGKPEITSGEVLASMFGMLEEHFRFGMVAFLDHRASLGVLEDHLYCEASEMAWRFAWAGARPDGSPKPLPGEEADKLRGLVRLALFEAVSARGQHETYAHETRLSPHVRTVRCPQCRGRGLVAGRACESLRDQLRQEAHELMLKRAPDEDSRRRKAVALAAIRSEIQEAHRPAEEDCSLCRGRGRYLLTDQARAESIGVSDRTWRRVWRDRYALVLSEAQRWERLAMAHVRRRLGL